MEMLNVYSFERICTKTFFFEILSNHKPLNFQSALFDHLVSRLFLFFCSFYMIICYRFEIEKRLWYSSLRKEKHFKYIFVLILKKCFCSILRFSAKYFVPNSGVQCNKIKIVVFSLKHVI